MIKQSAVLAAVIIMSANSGRLAALLRELGSARRWQWRVETVASPDRKLSQSRVPIATADSAILGRDVRWVNLARGVVATLEAAWLVVLGRGPST